MGGQQLVEWTIEEPALFEHIIPIATNAQHSPWGIVHSMHLNGSLLKQTLPGKKKTPEAGKNGMKTARGIALLFLSQL